MRQNIYPVTFNDFLKIIKVGNYVVTYAMLDDRVHFEMCIENSTFISQKFLEDIENEMEEKGSQYTGDKIAFYIKKMILQNKIHYRFFPTDEMIFEMKKYKLYKELVVKEIIPGVYDKDKVKYSESDNTINALSGSDIIFTAEKIQ